MIFLMVCADNIPKSLSVACIDRDILLMYNFSTVNNPEFTGGIMGIDLRLTFCNDKYTFDRVCHDQDFCETERILGQSRHSNGLYIWYYIYLCGRPNILNLSEFMKRSLL